MSVGNLKDSGNQGNNFPYQLKSLQGLQNIYDVLSKLLQPSSRTPVIERVSAIGAIPISYSFSVANVGSVNGAVMGITLAPGEVVNFDAGVLNNSFPSIGYDARGTTFLITYVI